MGELPVSDRCRGHEGEADAVPRLPLRPPEGQGGEEPGRLPGSVCSRCVSRNKARWFSREAAVQPAGEARILSGGAATWQGRSFGIQHTRVLILALPRASSMTLDELLK